MADYPYITLRSGKSGPFDGPAPDTDETDPWGGDGNGPNGALEAYLNPGPPPIEEGEWADSNEFIPPSDWQEPEQEQDDEPDEPDEQEDPEPQGGQKPPRMPPSSVPSDEVVLAFSALCGVGATPGKSTKEYAALWKSVGAFIDSQIVYANTQKNSNLSDFWQRAKAEAQKIEGGIGGNSAIVGPPWFKLIGKWVAQEAKNK